MARGPWRTIDGVLALLGGSRTKLQRGVLGDTQSALLDCQRTHSIVRERILQADNPSCLPRVGTTRSPGGRPKDGNRQPRRTLCAVVQLCQDAGRVRH